MNQSSVPESFVTRLRETVAWCQGRANLNDPKYCLRSPQLKPDVEFDLQSPYDVDIWVEPRMINQVVALRSKLVFQAPVPSTGLTVDLAGGRLLVHFLDESNHNGLTADITSSFLDYNDTPPWDTWVQVYIPEPSIYQSPNSVPSADAFLISWVPPEFLEMVDEATEAECVGMLMWADAPRSWEIPPVRVNSIPIWLQHLAPAQKIQ